MAPNLIRTKSIPWHLRPATLRPASRSDAEMLRPALPRPVLSIRTPLREPAS